MAYTTADLVQLAKQWGAIDVPRVVASIELAVQRHGADPEDMLHSLHKHQPSLFHGYKNGRS